MEVWSRHHQRHVIRQGKAEGAADGWCVPVRALGLSLALSVFAMISPLWHHHRSLSACSTAWCLS